MRLFRALLLFGLWQGYLCVSIVCQPKVTVVGGTKFSFGNLYTASKVQRVLSIRNDGTDTLNISDVSASCGCTAALISQNQIAPHKSGSLSISFDAGKYSGWVEKSVTFHSNDPAHPSMSVAFTANIVRVFELDPEYIIFSHAVVDSEKTQELSIKNISPKSIRILSSTTSSNVLSTQLSKSNLAPNEEITLLCTLHPRKAGSFNGNITIKTDYPQLPEYGIRFFAFVKEIADTTKHSN